MRDIMTICVECREETYYENGMFCSRECEYKYQDRTNNGKEYDNDVPTFQELKRDPMADWEQRQQQQYRVDMIRKGKEQAEAKKRTWEDSVTAMREDGRA